jgi:hypothetical protein
MSAHLKEAFREVCTLFNSANYDDLLPMLDPDVILKRVDDAPSVVGVGNVMAYLKGRQAELKPKLDSPKDITYVGGNGTNGQVSGLAQYHDSEKDKIGVAVRFTFTFNRGSDSEDWLLINAFAAPVG